MPTKGQRSGWVLALMLAAAAWAAWGDETAPAADVKKLQGTWTVPSGGGGEVLYTFKGETLEVKAPTRSYTMKVTLDPNAKPEKTIDLLIREGPDDAKGQTSKGIYKFEGDDTFVFCFSPQGDRPTKFEQMEFEQFLVTLKRKKPEEKKAE